MHFASLAVPGASDRYQALGVYMRSAPETLQPSTGPTTFQPGPVFASLAVRTATLPWIAGVYFLVLGASLLILNPGTPLFTDLPWLRGAITATSGLLLLWLAGIAERRAVVCGLYGLVAIPQLVIGLQFVWRGSYAPGATLISFALGLLGAAVVLWRRGEHLPSLYAVEAAGAGRVGSGAPLDLAGFVLAGSMVVQGLDDLLRPGAAAGLPPLLASWLPTLGVLFLAGGIALALAQVLPRLPARVRWAAHGFAGLVLLWTWVLFSAGGALGVWLRGSSLALSAVAAAFLPYLGSSAARLDRQTFYLRLALALVTATTLPLLIGLTAMVAFESPSPSMAVREIAFSVAILTLAAGTASGVLLAARLSRPLQLVVQGVGRIASGERNVRLVEPESTTEILELSHAVHNMAARLDGRAAEQAQLAQLTAVQEERQRVARELHDSTAQTLAAIGMSAHSALTNWQTRPGVARDRIELTGSLARRAQAEMRALIFELRPDQLQVDGLVTALELQVAALAARGEFSIEAALCEEPALPLAAKEVFFRVAQEALNNAAQHARPKQVQLTLSDNHSRVNLAVQDDGAGFDPDAQYPGHLGLRSMRERATRIGAELTINGGPAGTVVRLSYPLPPDAQAG